MTLSPPRTPNPCCGCDWVVDAIDQVKVKVALIALCRRLGMPFVTGWRSR